MQRGSLVVCGDAGEALGDSMYGGRSTSPARSPRWGRTRSTPSSATTRNSCAPSSSATNSTATRPRSARSSPAASCGTSPRRSSRYGKRLCRQRDGRVGDRVSGRVLRPSHIWSPEVIEDIQEKAEIGRYRIRAYSTLRRTVHFQDLTFVPCTLTRIPLEGYRERCETRTVIGARHGAEPIAGAPITIRGDELRRAVGERQAGARLGAASRVRNIHHHRRRWDAPRRARTRRRSCTRYCEAVRLRSTPSPDGRRSGGRRRPEHQPGTGRPARRCRCRRPSPRRARCPRESASGSPVRHPDFFGPDDLQIKIEELREATDGRSIYVQIGACRVLEDVKLAAKAGADVIVLDGLEERHGRLARGAARPHRDPDAAGDRARFARCARRGSRAR